MAWRPLRSSLRGLNYLDLVPRHAVTGETADDGEQVVLLMPRYRDFLFGRLLQPLLRGEKSFIRVPLDPRGSWIWGQVDGVRTVGDLAVAFGERFPEEDEQVAERVCQYVAAMVGNGFMEIGVHETGSE